MLIHLAFNVTRNGASTFCAERMDGDQDLSALERRAE